MSKKKKKLDLAENQVIEETVDKSQEISDSSEKIVEEFSNVSEEIVEEKIDSPEETIEHVSKDTEVVEEKPSPIVAEEGENKVEETNHKKSLKMWMILSVCLFFILLLFLLFSTVFALAYGPKSTIVQGVFIKDIDVSSLTKEQALEKVLTTFKEKLEQPITLIHNEYETTVFPEQFDVSFALEEAVDMAYAKGRSRKYFSK